MARIKLTIALLCVLLVNHHVTAVINKVSSQSSSKTENDKSDSVAAEDRISNHYGPPSDSYGPPSDNYGPPSDTYGPPSDSYGPPPSNKYKGPAPVYGPPELTGDYRPPKVYDPLPPEQPPPLSSPPKPFYGPPSKPKQQYGPPKSSYGPPPSIPKQNYGPPKSQYGPPKSQYGPPKSQYGPPKSQYGPPKSSYRPAPSFRPPRPEYGPPSKFSGPASSQYGPPSGGFGNGPSIPLSVEAYVPPVKQGGASFVSKPQDSYGAPPPIQTAPQQQYGAPNDLYGPPPPPPPGVPAPPTPPDIKYDGWQPIAGHINAPSQQPSNDYGPPLPSNDYGPSAPSNNYGPPPPTNDYSPPPPSNEYGPPAPSNDYGAPPALNDFSSTSNQYRLPTSGANFGGISSDNGHLGSIVSNPNVPSDSYGTPLNHPEDHSLKSIVSHATNHESDGLPPPALPQFEPLHNLQKAIDSSPSNNVEQRQPNNQYGVPDADIVPTVGFELLQNSGGHSHGHNFGGQPSGSYGLPSFGGFHSSGGDNFSLQHLSAPSGNYGLPSFSSSHKQRGIHSFNSNIHKGNGHYRGRNRVGFRPPPPPPSGFMLPRRPPMKFRDSVPAALISNINKYLPPSRPHKTYGAPIVQKQQLPSAQHSAPFHSPSIAAPNVNYGTPLSFNDFNTPAPTLTYGAPNFGPASSFGATGNLYQGIETSLAPTYGAPNAHGSDCYKNSGNLQYNFDSQSLNYDSPHQQSINIDYRTPAVSSVSNYLSSTYTAPNLNELELENNHEHQENLKDSYGNPLDNNFAGSDKSGSAISTHSQSTLSEFSDSSSHSQNSLTEGSSSQALEGLSVEALTAALTSQGFGEAKNIIPSTEVDARQFLKSAEGDQALTLAQTLTADGDGFQIQGSQGTYTLQIQPAGGGGFGTENSDGSIKHEQVLSNGLLQNILAAIEQRPEGGQIELQRVPIPQQEQKRYSHDLSQSASSSIINNIESSNPEQPKQLRGDISSNNEINNDQDSAASDHSRVALFFNQNLINENTESRSASKNEQKFEVTSDEKESKS